MVLSMRSEQVGDTLRAESIDGLRTPTKKMFQRLDEYMNAHDGFLPPARGGTFEERELRRWLVKLYSNTRRAPSPGILDALRVRGLPPRRLPDVTSKRGVQEKNRGHVLERLEALDAFVQEHGESPGANTDPSLYNWLYLQRRAFTNGTLDPWLQQELEQRGLLSQIRRVSWEAHLEQLDSFVAANGRWPRDTTKEAALRSWLKQQRRAARKGALSQRRVEALRERGYLETHAVTRWWERLREVQAFCAEHGHRPRRWVAAEAELGTWVYYQRAVARSGGLTLERIRELERAGILERGRTDPAAWEERLEELVAFALAHKRLPHSYAQDPDEQRLSSWLAAQFYRTGRAVHDPMCRQRLDDVLESFFRAWMAEAEAWCVSHRRLPRYRAADPEERRLFNFLQASRHKADRRKAVEDLWERYGRTEKRR